MNLDRAQIQTMSIADYFYQPLEGAPVLLLLHGFNERAKRILRNISSILPQDMAILAPNAPFPLPQRIKNETGEFYKIGFAWYFFDDIKEEFYIDYEYPVQWLKSLLNTLKLNHRPIIILGYSQGGYLAPFIAQSLENCAGVIGVHCRFRDDLLRAEPQAYPLYSLHAELDDKVDTERSQKSAHNLRQKGYDIQSIVIKGEGHDLGPYALIEMQKIIQNLKARLSKDA